MKNKVAAASKALAKEAEKAAKEEGVALGSASAGVPFVVAEMKCGGDGKALESALKGFRTTGPNVPVLLISVKGNGALSLYVNVPKEFQSKMDAKTWLLACLTAVCQL